MNHIFKFISNVRQAEKDKIILTYYIDMINDFDEIVTFEIKESANKITIKNLNQLSL